MTELTFNDNWLSATQNLDAGGLLSLALLWCEKVEKEKWPADPSVLACAVERNNRFLRSVAPYIKEEHLNTFTRMRGDLMDIFGFKKSPVTRITKQFWYGEDFERREMLLNLAKIDVNTASALLKTCVSSQNRFWDIASAYKDDAAARDAAIWCSLLTGLTSSPVTALPCKQLFMYRTLGLSLTHRSDWDESIYNDLIDSIENLKTVEVINALPSLAKALKYVVDNHLPMNGLRAVSKTTSNTFSVFDAMALLLPNSKMNWQAAESLGLTFDEAVNSALEQCEVAMTVELPNTMTV